jgi:hypothetical protein
MEGTEGIEGVERVVTIMHEDMMEKKEQRRQMGHRRLIGREYRSGIIDIEDIL